MEVNLSAPVNQLGYGIVGLNVLAGLRRQGHSPALWVLGLPEVPEQHRDLVNEAIARTSTFDRLAPSLRIWHQFDLAQHVGKGLHAALPIFELDRFRPVELHHLKQQDLVIVASAWAADILKANGIDNISIAPFGVDHDIFFPRDVDTAPEQPTIFLNVGKWELRKGHDLIVKAFNKAFAPSDNVKLVMLCYNPCFADPEKLRRYNEQWANLYRRSALAEKIQVAESRLPTQEHVAEIMAAADCGVFPTRAEGWNLELGEMLAMGKTCIASNCSAHTQFVRDYNCKLIETTTLEDAYDGVWFFGQGKWYEMGDDQLEQLVVHMRDVHAQKQAGKSMRNQAGIDMMKEFTWDHTVQTLSSALQRKP